MKTVYVIEARRPDGSLDLSGRQPEATFGPNAITGMDDWQMSRVILREVPEQFDKCRGDNVAEWPSFIDPRWHARRKTW
jgi:hypothetical protein